jgi:beta-phosphoglucomutase
MMKFTAIIFDMDGTMVDNMMVHNRGWQMILKQYGLDLTMEEVMATCHGKNIEIIERLFPGKYTLAEREQISFEKESWYRSIFQPELIEGLPELLEAAHQAGIPMGIGTAAPKANLDFVLDHLNIRHYFKAILHADDVKWGKPDPEVFLRVAALLGTEPGDCLVFEDSPTGAKTAVNAGMKAVILTTTHQEHEFSDISSVMKCVDTYAELEGWHFEDGVVGVE